ncbi:UNVERIFIED_CONTAM: hypothetical protein HDU68_001637, partial [Siphonaria sp. JEL0065]
PLPEVVRIGSTAVSVPPFASLTHPEKVPVPNQLNFLQSPSQTTLVHMEWLMKRQLLMHCFLIGPPPSHTRRQLVMEFLSLTHHEMEYISLHRDISAESDLKQRREIVRKAVTKPLASVSTASNISVQWNDSVVVSAAVHGRVLVIDGIERAERNVLTILNNLLENREIELNGRHIIHPMRYDELLRDHSQTEMDSLGLIRASEKFQVIALGLPIPPFPGNPLDPPFRSRFQVRYIPNLHLRLPNESEQARKMKDFIQIINQANNADFTMASDSSTQIKSAVELLLPRFPESALSRVESIITMFHAESIGAVLHRVWPHAWIGKGLSTDQTKRVTTLLKNTFGIAGFTSSDVGLTKYRLTRVIPADSGNRVPRAEFMDGNGCKTEVFCTIVIAVANIPAQGSSAAGLSWLNEETANRLHFIKVGELDAVEERLIVDAHTNVPEPILSKLLEFSHKFREMSSHHTPGLSASSHLSTRQLIELQCEFPRLDANWAIFTRLFGLNAWLLSFLLWFANPFLICCVILVLKKSTLMKRWKSRPPTLICVLEYTQLKPFHVPIDDTHSRSLIPTSKTGSVSSSISKGFFDNAIQTRLLRNMAIDFSMGEHLLLIGNQGVGKNKITDRFLELLGRPSEYMQLHRDTTVSSLTATPTVENGLLIMKDSPLLKAVKFGRVLIIDEADKAPVMITAALKSLAEKGEMGLVDGRKIQPVPVDADPKAMTEDAVIRVHKDFRMIVLANRPGYPFLGNNFFSTIGEAFACHPIENPDAQSEIQLLEQAAPNVDRKIIKRLVLAFDELRKAFDDGLIAYPYSLRELLNIVRHMESFPHDSLGSTLRNDFDFDLHKPEVMKLLQHVFAKHGLDLSGFDDIFGILAQKSGVVLKLTREPEVAAKKSPANVLDPKHGRVDPKTEPHVGGNTWHGGTGGSSTAGLGGRGGPYRQDSGHQVHQLSDAEKAQVPAHVLEAARKMGKEVLSKRLSEINMSAFEAEMYSQCYEAVKEDIQRLKIVLEGTKSKEKERVWVKNQTVGELDDAKLVEGIIGETTIYKTRGNEEQEFGLIQRKPKRVKIVFDVSGSMYRFNGLDGRLNRSLETALLIMVSMDDSLRSKFLYDIVGHSGDSPSIEFVNAAKPPQNELERLRILQNMSAHAQYCWSGDNTMLAAQKAISSIVKNDADEYFVIILSDANLKRYGISAHELSGILESDGRVQAAIVFIGSLGNEATNLVKQLPCGKAFLAMDTSKVPGIMKEMFQAIAG